MPNIETEVNVDVDIFINQCSKKEKAELIKALVMEGELPPEISTANNAEDLEWNTRVTKLYGNQWRLSNEDIEHINRITNLII